MSASEIITVIKAINDHVTVKYCGLIIDYLAEKKKAHLVFERTFFNEVDKAVGQLINDMIHLFNATDQESEPFKKTQMYCTQYNKWKQNKYDEHLLKIEELEKGVDGFIKKTFSEKLSDQHVLFDEALSVPLSQNDLNEDNIEEKQKKPQNGNDKYSNLFNDNITCNTIFSSSSSNTNDIKSIRHSSDEEKTHQNEVIYHTPITQNVNNINAITLNLSSLSNIANNNEYNKNGNTNYGLNSNINKFNNNISVLDCNRNETNITLPIPPPKPPPPISTYCSESELSDISNTCSVDHICDQQFSARLRWESHFLTHQPSKQIKTRPKREKKRNFQNMNVGYNKLDVINKSNKRSCHRYQCEYCDKSYFRQTSYIKHYNNHMITNKNNQCNFCLNKFKVKEDLKYHINEFGAGIAADDGFYQCCQCTMRFERKNELTLHITSQHKTYSTGDEERNKSVEFI